jgi:hypothetical protein
MNKYLFSLLLCVIGLGSKATTIADSSDYYNSGFIRYSDFTYKPTIKTVQLFNANSDLFTPIINLNSGDKLELDFDDFDTNIKNYNYTFVHCDADWNPSDLVQNQYLNGFAEDKIFNYKFSINTLQKFVHYNLVFPTNDMQPFISGNYILKVYQDTPDNLVLTRRFMITENTVEINTNIHKATNIDDMNTKQEVDFNILYPQYDITDPWDALKVVIVQNDRWDNVISNLKPQFVKEKELVYNYDEGNTFNGGNEFRNFDIRTLRFHTERIAEILVDTLQHNHAYIYREKVDPDRPYSTIPDINGKYTIKLREELSDSKVESDYTYVHFDLPINFPVAKGNFYVFGQLTNWNCNFTLFKTRVL